MAITLPILKLQSPDFEWMRIMIMTIMMMKTQNGHNSANFEATTSRFCIVIDLNKLYRMMITMMMIMMMKTRNGHNLANFEATFSRFGIVIGCNDTDSRYCMEVHMDCPNKL